MLHVVNLLNLALKLLIHICSMVKMLSFLYVHVWCACLLDHVNCANCIHLILPFQLLAGYTESNPGPKPTLKTLLHTLTQSPTLTKYTNSPVQPSQSSPPSLSPTHSPPNSPTSVQSTMPPLQNTPTYHRASIQLHTFIYLKQHTGPLDVSREGGASASQVERTPGRATLTSWVVGLLHCHTQDGWVDNNNNST